MQPIQQVTDNLWINHSGLFTYHSGIFVSRGEAIVIDPGLAQDEIKALQQFMREQDWNVTGIILTHGHWDHVLGTGAFPGVSIIAHDKFLTSKRNDPAGIQQIISKTPDLEWTGVFIMPQPDVTFGETTTLQVGALTLELKPTPGHAPDHLFVFEPASKTVWTADMLSDEEIPYVIDSLGEFENTLNGIRPEDYRTLVPCHGTVATGDEIRARIENDRAYVSELAARVRSAVSSGKTIDETKALCADIPYRQAVEGNRRAHELNVESAYRELGGKSDGNSVGWARSWQDLTT